MGPSFPHPTMTVCTKNVKKYSFIYSDMSQIIGDDIGKKPRMSFRLVIRHQLCSFLAAQLGLFRKSARFRTRSLFQTAATTALQGNPKALKGAHLITLYLILFRLTLHEFFKTGTELKGK